MESRQVRVRIMIYDEMNGLDVALRRHGEIGFDDHRYYSAVLRDDGHVETHVTSTDWPVTGHLFQDPGYFLIGNLGVLRPSGSQDPLGSRQGAGRDESGRGCGAGSEKRSAG
jgi:hypothetical protein